MFVMDACVLWIALCPAAASTHRRDRVIGASNVRGSISRCRGTRLADPTRRVWGATVTVTGDQVRVLGSPILRIAHHIFLFEVDEARRTLIYPPLIFFVRLPSYHFSFPPHFLFTSAPSSLLVKHTHSNCSYSFP
ncbi:hypothetical protein C8Q76DRAFT_104428 [Earliella scabrosa]|nr:hypothetical protein C8Q76DRAFT_104428 [Earliella scabrosa]